MPVAEILSQGDEVVTGQIADTNAAWIAERLTEAGFVVARHTTVGDSLGAIAEALREISTRCDLCVCTGGLGPTDDDYTARAVEAAFGRPLAFDAVAMAAIESIYAAFKRVMPEINRRQAWIPSGATRVDNRWGTAPGFAVDERDRGAGRALFVFMPGVPREMKPMYEQNVAPILRERFALRPGRLVTLRTVGVGESELQQRLGAWSAPGVVIGYRTTLPENWLKLRFSPDVEDAAIADAVAAVRARLGSVVFAVEGVGEPAGSLIEMVAHKLRSRSETLAVAESCTGGQIAAQCVAVPGASAWFVEGAVTYSNTAKVRQLGVSPEVIERVGAVSTEVCTQMAAGIRSRAAATYGLAVTGIAGPDGGSADKPVGTVHIALDTGRDVHHRLLRLGGDRPRVQSLAAAGALDLLRRHLDGLL
jgi:nicotinamide-nucleotide amidase